MVLKQFIFLNGDELLTNPGKVMCDFEKKMNIGGFFCNETGGKFVRSDQGFFCFERGIQNLKGKKNWPRCAHYNSSDSPAAKGTTRDAETGKSMVPVAVGKVLEDFYTVVFQHVRARLKMPIFR